MLEQLHLESNSKHSHHVSSNSTLASECQGTLMHIHSTHARRTYKHCEDKLEQSMIPSSLHNCFVQCDMSYVTNSLASKWVSIKLLKLLASTVLGISYHNITQDSQRNLVASPIRKPT